MSQSSLKINSISAQERCDVCHQSDMFDPETKYCSRCQQIALLKATELTSTNIAPLPDFLTNRLNLNMAIRCHSCNEFIMSRSLNCRHCGAFVRWEEAAHATQQERQFGNIFERLQKCKAASNLSWEFLRLHLWAIPITLLLTPLTAIGSLLLFIRTLWLGVLSFYSLSSINQKNDPRVRDSRREVLSSVAKSGSAFALVSAVAVIIIYSGLIALPQ
jgi:hypothetical protein